MTESITKLVYVMAGGGVPDLVAPFMCGATFFDATKKDGGVPLETS